jgi:hypothetical protein
MAISNQQLAIGCWLTASCQLPIASMPHLPVTDTAAILGTGTADRYRIEGEHTLTI